MTAPPALPPRAASAAADRMEPRALRSRTLILAAVRSALADTPLDDLTVSELSRRAGVHRVTFYGHWPDVRAAAADAFAEVIDGIATIGEQDVAAAASSAELAALYERALRQQLIEIRDNRAVYRPLFDSSIFSDRLFSALVQRAELAIGSLVRLGVGVPGAESGIAAAHLAGGVVAASGRWAHSADDDVDRAVTESLAQVARWWPLAVRGTMEP